MLAVQYPPNNSAAVAAPEVGIHLEGITKRFGEVVAVDDVDVVIREGEFFSLLGPSGCGKTTSLRMIAGFERYPTPGGCCSGTRTCRGWAGWSASACPTRRSPPSGPEIGWRLPGNPPTPSSSTQTPPPYDGRRRIEQVADATVSRAVDSGLE